MDYTNLLSIKVLPRSVSEINKTVLHLPYKEERKLLASIQNGDIDGLISKITALQNIVVGALSEDSLQQFRYLAVCYITLAVRYAIDGGMNEPDAFLYSDNFIQKLDVCNNSDEVMDLMIRAAMQLTNSVNEAKRILRFPPHVRQCIRYINENLDKKITLEQLSSVCGLSRDYLSHIFKKEYGESVSSYIRKKKLDAARTLLLDGCSLSETAKRLSFSSVSGFISVFKSEYGITPGKFQNMTK